MNKRKLDSQNEENDIKKPKIVHLGIEANGKVEEVSAMAEVEIKRARTSVSADRFEYDESLDGIEFDDIDFAVAQAQTERSDFLDLTGWRRCVVEECERDTKSKDLIIRGREENGDSDKRMLCRLQEMWAFSKLEVGEPISIKAAWGERSNSYCVTSREGFIVTRPDLLVSGTSVVGGLFCLRKAILSDRFKGIDPSNKIMTIGSIVHELLQIVLKRRLRSLEDIEKASEKLLQDTGIVHSMYASQIGYDEARVEVNKFHEQIHGFVERYLHGKPLATDKNKSGFDGIIDSIQDIEENLWMPRLGMKGKIDVSANVRPKSYAGTKPAYMPLELKTGRATFSSEHTGQLIIYQMMLSEARGEPTNAGLLLYLREGVVKQVKGTRNEQRDLVILRNELAHYLTRQEKAFENLELTDKNEMAIAEIKAKIIELSANPELPEPINHHSACQNCPYQVLCCVYLKNDPETLSSLNQNHTLRELMPKITAHLLSSHIEYFCRWSALLALEDGEGKTGNQVKNMWLERPEKRASKKRAIVGLKLSQNVQEQPNGMVLHEFQTDDDDLTKKDLTVGEYLIVSTTSRLAVAAGFVQKIESKSVSLSLERNLRERYSGCSFILDKYESQSVSSFNLANLGVMLEDTESAERLRRIIVDKDPPTFCKQLPKVVVCEGKTILRRLNPIQRTAVLKALTANDYVLIKGLPGTGKTQTLTAIIELLVLMKKSILITSHTHSAVDNLLLRLKRSNSSIQFMRLGSQDRINSALTDHSEAHLTRDCTAPEHLAKIYDQFQIFGVTCRGSAHPLLTQRTFDVCLVDESTQVLQPTVLRPLFFAKKFILVGDPDQLPPIIRSSEAKLLGAEESLFTSLDSEEATVTLKQQYRMNKSITKLANALTYSGALECGNEEVSKATMKVQLQTKCKWLSRALSTQIDQSVTLINTGNVHSRCKAFAKGSAEAYVDETKEKPDSRLYVNYCEAAVIFTLVKELLDSGMQGSSIGVIAPYVLQVNFLKKILSTLNGDLEMNTVDQYQGRDKEVIIYSGTRTGNPPRSKSNRSKFEILEDKRRLTVAITRAKHKLLLIGDEGALRCYEPFKRLFESLPSLNKINLAQGQMDFDWDGIGKCVNL